MSLTCKDIINRQKNLITDSYTSKANCNVSYVYENLSKKYSYNKAKLILENWQALSNNESEALEKVLEVFSIITENDNESNIRNAANLIEGKIIPKLRDAKATRHLNNYKLGKLKIQNTKVLNHTKDNTDANKRARANGGSVGNSLHPHRKYKRDIYGNKIGENKSSSSNEEDNESKQQEVEECFNRFIYRSWVNDQCDRVISNHNKLIKRFDLESKVRSCSLNESDLEDCIGDICYLIDGYDIPFGVKYNVALENILFLMNKNCIPIDDKMVLETVTNYFLSRDITDDQLHDMNYIIENAKFFSKEDLECVSYLNDTEEEATIIESTDEFSDIVLTEAKNKNDTSKIKKAIHDFKKSNKKTIDNAKSCLSRIFVNSPENIINELPDIFIIVRMLVAIGAIAINPILGVITMITGFFLKMHVSRKQMAKVVSQYEKERDKYKKKMDKATDEKQKERYEKLYKQYKKDASKLEDYERSLYTDKENEKRDEEKWAKEIDSSSGDGFDDFDFDFNFDESAMINDVDRLALIAESMVFKKSDIMNTIKNNISIISTEDIYNLTESVKLCNNIFDCPRYISILEEELLNTRAKASSINRYQRIDAIKECIYEINQMKYDNLLEDYHISDDYCPIDLICENLKYQQEVLDDTLELITRYKNNTITESKDEKSGISFTSKLKIASENLRRTALKLKDKDKQLSMKLDSELNRTSKAVQRALVSDSREKIIKGSLIPSASKCIHLAVAGGAAWLVSPALAVISALGYVGMSKKLTEKERNLVIDDIDIEIDMCERYLRQAEDKNDLVAVRDILKIKRDLERQRHRLLYNKNTLFKGKKGYKRPSSIKVKDEKDDD